MFFDDLCDEIGKDLDPFDLILHIVFDQPPLTRKERAEHVRKRNYFTKYGEKAAEILEALLTKYADSGLNDLENVDVLKVDDPRRAMQIPPDIQTAGIAPNPR